MHRTNTLPDESLASEVLPPLLVVIGAVSAMSFGLLLLAQWRASISPYLITGALVASVWASGSLFQRGRLRTAGVVISYALALLPICSIIPFGLLNNTLIYLSAIGVIAAGVLIAPDAPIRVARVALGTLMVLVVFPSIVGQERADLGPSLAVGMSMTALLLSAAALTWAAGYAIHGTIGWALETSSKSERREQLLRATQADLERTLRERDQLNDRLYKLTLDLETARAEAEAAYRSKASFMATMSHELRTPLNIIIGFSSAMIDHPEMYDGEPISEAISADIAEIRRSGQHLLGLINDILDLARVEVGRLELNKAAVPLVPLLDEMMRTASGLLKDRPVLLRREYVSPLPTVLVDDVRVRQVLLNLVSNACKFTSVGEISVGARAENYEVIVWVRDTGIGIADSDQTRIFNQFEQVESHDAKQHPGTGLGLSICRWLVELHGGRMWLESELGKGSIFSFTLPRVQPALNGAASKPPEQ
ncbi:HAMP domain-containing histidine kinase [Oscillochloris sp. ZM17-4]|uniref:sensor histidine kinase n=1 Tax=Oscillochloris sp. ZM17-4 TaxID=2866714 RepID=UPI001C739FA3|nr:HAMP domain-containing sensor histidine kinase [Oscillochloris sp. ZM17-4]MBX0326539.1 HAMP domain-containing histidine kinase [Oscillochloris sp. ZM17-4]